MITLEQFINLDAGTKISIQCIGYKLLTKPYLAINASVRNGKATYHAVIESLDIAAYGPSKAMHMFALDDVQNSFMFFHGLTDWPLDSSYPRIKSKPVKATNCIDLII